MPIIETLLSISGSPFLMKPNFRFCLIDSNKLPYKIDGSFAKSNCLEDFVEFEALLNCSNITKYSGVAISIQASNIYAIDVDHCFEKPFDLSTGDHRATEIINQFKEFSYIEFSFSGKGLRILFEGSPIENYSNQFYIKNSKNGIEYYQPRESFRYVSVTGRSICCGNNSVDECKVMEFLTKFMTRPVQRASKVSVKCETRSIAQLLILVKKLYYKDSKFQDLWFSRAPGSGKNESELDFQLLSYIFENITTDRIKGKEVFEASPYFQSKDFHHRLKWTRSENKYYNYMYDNILKGL